MHICILHNSAQIRTKPRTKNCNTNYLNSNHWVQFFLSIVSSFFFLRLLMCQFLLAGWLVCKNRGLLEYYLLKLHIKNQKRYNPGLLRDSNGQRPGHLKSLSWCKQSEICIINLYLFSPLKAFKFSKTWFLKLPLT